MVSTTGSYAANTGQHLQTQMRRLQAQAISGKKARYFSEMGADTALLLGSSGASFDAQHLQEACSQQKMVLDHSQSLMNVVGDTLVSMQTETILYGSLPDLGRFWENYLSTLGQKTAQLIQFLNAETTAGYIFGGAQTDVPPIRSDLLEHLTAPGGPKCTLEELPDYFSGLKDTQAQLPLTLYNDTQSGHQIEIPLRAEELLNAFMTLHQLFSVDLHSMSVREDLQSLAGGFEPAALLVRNSQVQCVETSKALEFLIGQAVDDNEAAHNQKDDLLALDQMQNAFDILENSRAFQAFIESAVMAARLLQEMDRAMQLSS